MAPDFLSLEDVIAIHQDQIENYGGSHGIRDLGLLQSAVAQPSSGMGGEFFHSDLVEMAAAYLFHLVKNHPFIDGNKRVGATAAHVFLRMNGLELTATNEAFEALVLAVADGSASKSKATEFLRKHSRARRAEK